MIAHHHPLFLFSLAVASKKKNKQFTRYKLTSKNQLLRTTKNTILKHRIRLKPRVVSKRLDLVFFSFVFSTRNPREVNLGKYVFWKKKHNDTDRYLGQLLLTQVHYPRQSKRSPPKFHFQFLLVILGKKKKMDKSNTFKTEVQISKIFKTATVLKTKISR